MRKTLDDALLAGEAVLKRADGTSSTLSKQCCPGVWQGFTAL